MIVSAAVARTPDGDFSIERLEIDAPRDDEILVRVAAVGICHTDIVFKTREAIALPAVFGHEAAGTIMATGSAVSAAFSVGDHVALTFRSCGTCDRCVAGSPAYCRSMPQLNYAGRRPDGSMALHAAQSDVASNFFGQSSFATHCLAYERNVVKIPADLPLELMGPLGCGVQTGFGAVRRSLACPAGSSILILGCGPVGLSAVMAAAIQGCSPIIVLEPFRQRRELALELGATHALGPAYTDDLGRAIKAIHGTGVDFVLDTTGSPSLIERALQTLGSQATLGLVGIFPRGATLPGELNNLITFGHSIKGIIEGDSDPSISIPEMISFYREGRLPIDRLVRTYPFNDINRAVADQARGDCIKAVLLMD
ncbi:MAG: NAD(P)-dependent alcohol dehydrogenase [Rhizomicrobium sp.]